MRSRGTSGKAGSKSNTEGGGASENPAVEVDDNNSKDIRSTNNKKKGKNNASSAKDSSGKMMNGTVRSNYFRPSNILCVCAATIGMVSFCHVKFFHTDVYKNVAAVLCA
jgi:hypothetical protein